MRTLLEQLTPECKVKLEDKRELYGTAIDIMYKRLNEVESYNNLEYLVINALVSFLNLKDYSPKTISEIFNR